MTIIYKNLRKPEWLTMPKALPLIFGLLIPVAVFGQSAAVAGASVPTTKVLAIGRVAKGATMEKVMAIMGPEVRDTVRLYLTGKIDQWYVRKDLNGVVFILNSATLDEAKTALGKLPLVEHKLLEFELIPLGPLSPLRLIVSDIDTPATQKN